MSTEPQIAVRPTRRGAPFVPLPLPLPVPVPVPDPLPLLPPLPLPFPVLFEEPESARFCPEPQVSTPDAGPLQLHTRLPEVFSGLDPGHEPTGTLVPVSVSFNT